MILQADPISSKAKLCTTIDSVENSKELEDEQSLETSSSRHYETAIKSNLILDLSPPNDDGFHEIVAPTETEDESQRLSSAFTKLVSSPSVIVSMEEPIEYMTENSIDTEYQEASFVLDPPILIPKKNTVSDTHSPPLSLSVSNLLTSRQTPQQLRVTKSVRFTLDANYCLYERNSWDPFVISHKKISLSSKSNKKRRRRMMLSNQRNNRRGIKSRQRKSSSVIVSQTKQSRYPHPSKVLIVVVFIAILFVFFVAKKKKKQVNDPLDLLLAFI